MVATIPQAMQREMRESGVWFVDRDRGAQAFLDALDAGDVVIGLDLPATQRVLEVSEALSPDMGWLADHALFGRPTVPMAVILDDVARMGSALLGPVEVTDLTLFDGVTVDKPVAS